VYVVDASVWVSHFLSNDEHHLPSREWLTRIGRRRIGVAAPLILLAEVAGAISRRTADSVLAREYICRLEALPYTRLFRLDLDAGRRAATVAADLRVSGADAMYVSLGVELGMHLVTWDGQQRERARALMLVSTPRELLDQMLP
jgi:predicted nucleic acid-binding protein